MNTTRFCVFLIITGLISACGFHLKGKNNTAVTFPTIYLDCGSCTPQLNTALTDALRHNNIAQQDSADQAISLTINDTREDSFDTAIGDYDQSKEIRLTQSFNAQLSRNGQLLGKQHISSSAFVRLDSNTYLGSNSEADEAMQQLYKENANKLVNFITTLTLP